MNLLKKNLALIFLLLSLPFLSSSVQAEEIKIGVIIPLSGGWKVWGDRIRQSIDLSFELLNTDKLKLIPYYEDEATCDPKKAVIGYNVLREKGIKIFVVGCMTGTVAILPQAKRDGSLLISAGFQEERSFTQGAMIINSTLQMAEEGIVMSADMNKEGDKKIGIIRNPGIDEMIDALKRGFGENGPDIVSDEEVEGDQTDLRSVVSRVVNRSPDAIFINLPEQQFVQTLKRLRETKYSGRIYSTYGLGILINENAELKQLAQGVRYSYPNATDMGTMFAKRFEEKYKIKAPISTLFINDVITLLFADLLSCEPKSPECVFKKIATGESRRGASGNYSIQADGSIKRELKIFTVLP